MANVDIRVEPAGFVENPEPGVPFDGIVILLNQDALDRIREHAEAHLDQEIGGLLVGNLWENDGITYVEVCEIVPAQTQGTLATVSFTGETWIELERQKERLFPGYRKVGWYHSHVGCGIFLSTLDEFLHQNAFSLPWQIAFVYDPVIGDYGFFRWDKDALVPARFYLDSGGETFKERLLSQWVGQRLRLLAGYLEKLQHDNPLTRESRHLHSKLERLNSEKTFLTSLVEDTLGTLVALSDIEPLALSQAKMVLDRFIGKSLLLGKNVDTISPLVFDSPAIEISYDRIFFGKGTELFRASLSQEYEVAAISVPGTVCDIATSADSLFALNPQGVIYVVPFSKFESIPSTSKQQGVSMPTPVEVETITLSPSPGEQFRAIAAHANSLYLITAGKVWVIDLKGSKGPKPNIYDISQLEGQIPVDAWALAVDSQGHIYIADIANSRVLQMSPNGRVKYVFLADGRISLVSPESLCVKGQELYVLDALIRRIIVYDLRNKTYARQYNWGNFVEDRTIQRLYSDGSEQVYFSAGLNVNRLYRLKE